MSQAAAASTVLTSWTFHTNFKLLFLAEQAAPSFFLMFLYGLSHPSQRNCFKASSLLLTLMFSNCICIPLPQKEVDSSKPDCIYQKAIDHQFKLCCSPPKLSSPVHQEPIRVQTLKKRHDVTDTPFPHHHHALPIPRAATHFPRDQNWFQGKILTFACLTRFQPEYSLVWLNYCKVSAVCKMFRSYRMGSMRRVSHI